MRFLIVSLVSFNMCFQMDTDGWIETMHNLIVHRKEVAGIPNPSYIKCSFHAYSIITQCRKSYLANENLCAQRFSLAHTDHH